MINRNIVLFVLNFILGFHGIRMVDDFPKILNGTSAKIGQFPFVVHIRRIANAFACTGTLITSQQVLTAAHCYKNFTKPCQNCPLGICVAGDIYRLKNANSATSRQEREIIKLAMHPKYSTLGVSFDLAVLTTKTPFSISKNLNTVPLANTDLRSGDICISVGFGVQKVKPKLPKVDLAWIYSTVFTKGCRKSTVWTKAHLQAVYFGDSGGPLIDSTNKSAIHGVLDRSINQNRPYDGTIYAKVNANREWILGSLNPKHKQSGTYRNSGDSLTNLYAFVIFWQWI